MYKLKKPEKRCDICLVRRMRLKVPIDRVLLRLSNDTKRIFSKINALTRAGKEVPEELQKDYERIRTVIARLKGKKDVEVCSVCAKEPDIIILRKIANKVKEGTSDEVCMDCPMCWEDECRFMQPCLSEKEERRRDRLSREYGRLILC